MSTAYLRPSVYPTSDSFAKIRASAHKCGSAQNDMPEDQEIAEYLVAGVLQ